MSLKFPPSVLLFAGNDPTGGAGLCADIQALASVGCQAAPVVTCITIQNTRDILENNPLPGSQVKAQAEAVLADIPIAVCKIGLLGSVAIVEAVQHVLLSHPQLFTVLDPILTAGGGHPVANRAVREAILQRLVPLTDVLTPNSQEARLLTGEENLAKAAQYLVQKGCPYVCITGTHEESPTVVNSLYDQNGLVKAWAWPRLSANYHGSGCTFAASLAGFRAHGKEIVDAVYAAQQYTWTCLDRGYQPGQGQALPNRLYKLDI